MYRVYLANDRPKECSALRLLLSSLKMIIVGEATDWSTTLAKAPNTSCDLLLIDWDLLPIYLGMQALNKFYAACPRPVVVVAISNLVIRQQVTLSAVVDAFINRGDSPEHMARHLQLAAERLLTM
jgi:DNA-binding NarL/FixJ family response regulator